MAPASPAEADRALEDQRAMRAMLLHALGRIDRGEVRALAVVETGAADGLQSGWWVTQSGSFLALLGALNQTVHDLNVALGASCTCVDEGDD